MPGGYFKMHLLASFPVLLSPLLLLLLPQHQTEARITSSLGNLPSLQTPALNSLPNPNVPSLPPIPSLPPVPSLSDLSLPSLPIPTLPPLRFPDVPALNLPGLPTIHIADLPLDDLPEISPDNWIMKDTGAGALAGPLGGLLIGGLIAINVGAIAGYIVDKSGVLSRKKRQAESSPQVTGTESYILSAVGQIDTHGCILKMLCLLEAEEASGGTLTKEENLYVSFLSNKMPHFSLEANATALLPADGEGAELTPSEGECNQLFSRCVVGGQLLKTLLRVVWGFGFTSL
ncbi:uncharacterized protein LOC122265032 [Penaeus japonicus]|uniref:uncharacterized protein LOC122265032 n=1 Tax=Penaeus japonicus TaxID=27405 RepID=UPI001C711DC3|nr:uncharacterized protein LOC122265032 [Penaeus japonicus]